MQGALALYAFPGLRARSKATGWSILLLSSILNFFYGIFVAFTDYGSFGDIIGATLGTLVALYILAQIRGHYGAAKKATKTSKKA